MLKSRFAPVALAAACAAAAGAGGYLAVRQNGAAATAIGRDAGASGRAPRTLPNVSQTLPALPPVASPDPRASSAPRTTHPPVTPLGQALPASEPAPALAPPAAEPELTAAGSPVAPTVPVTSHWQGTPLDAPPPAPASPSNPADLVDSTPLRAELEPASVEQLVIETNAVIGLQMNRWVGSGDARVEDKVDARVTRDVRVDGRVAIPAGTRASGTVVMVERGGRFRGSAHLGVRFDTLWLPDGTQLSVSTETIVRFGRPPGRASAVRLGGGAVVGAIVGGVVGGGKGAAIGATTGAGAGAAATMAGDRDEAYFPAGAEVTARVTSPIFVTIERD